MKENEEEYREEGWDDSQEGGKVIQRLNQNTDCAARRLLEFGRNRDHQPEIERTNEQKPPECEGRIIQCSRAEALSVATGNEKHGGKDRRDYEQPHENEQRANESDAFGGSQRRGNNNNN